MNEIMYQRLKKQHYEILKNCIKYHDSNYGAVDAFQVSENIAVCLDLSCQYALDLYIRFRAEVS